ncbi:pyridoxamine 5'-phosphate oxidase family protein [Paenibacillus algorifonticola]|uniref:pyridoxamine 5'-phosphate oxidase family protein n=1 Tax=Paenibacillus algorifonticola TaxID=684063 RepID=UPI003D2DB229
MRDTKSMWIENRLEQKDLMPKLVKQEFEKEIRQDILDFLKVQEVANLATATPTNWPLIHAMHFATVADKENRPVFYLFSVPGTRKLHNITVNPQVGLSVYNLLGYENKKQAKAFQFIGIAEIINDEEEFKKALAAQRSKLGYEFTEYLPLEKQPCIRVDVLYGTWMDQSRKHPFVSLDYLRQV